METKTDQYKYQSMRWAQPGIDRHMEHNQSLVYIDQRLDYRDIKNTFPACQKTFVSCMPEDLSSPVAPMTIPAVLIPRMI